MQHAASLVSWLMKNSGTVVPRAWGGFRSAVTAREAGYRRLRLPFDAICSSCTLDERDDLRWFFMTLFFLCVMCMYRIVFSGDEEVSSLHPATIKADRLESELEESRMLREKDRLRYEVKLQEAERDKGKLLRQVMAFSFLRFYFRDEGM